MMGVVSVRAAPPIEMLGPRTARLTLLRGSILDIGCVADSQKIFVPA